MLVDNDVYVNRYVADGSTASFPIAFPFLEASHIEVYTRGEDGEDILVDPSMYTITGAGIEEGGELTFNTLPVAGTVIAIVRNVPITQLYAYTELDNFPAESHENALAKLTMIDQQQAEILGRAVLVPVTSDKTPEQLTAEIFQARDDAAESASDAASSAQDAADSATAAENKLQDVIDAGDSAISDISDAKDAAVDTVEDEGDTQVERLEQLAGTIIAQATQLYKVATIILDSDIASESIINTPTVNSLVLSYIVGKDMLGLSYNGVELYKGLQFEEVGTAGTASYRVKLLMPMYAGDQLCFKIMSAVVDSVVADPLQPDGTSIQIDANGKLSVVLTDQAITQAIGYTAADDSAVVKLTGNQTVSGVKTLTDYLAFQNTGIINVQKSDNSGVLSLYGGGNYQKGAYVTLKGIGQTSDPGSFSITATDGSSNVKAFFGKPDGTLTWGGKSILTNTSNVTIDGNIVRSANTGEIRLSGGTDATTVASGASLSLYGSTRSSSPGVFIIAAGTSSANYTRLIGQPDGTFTWGGQPIQTTSDERLKTPMADVLDTILDAWGEVGWGQFQYLDAVEKKGSDRARLHLGLIAQRVKAVFDARGLDACKYGILCYEAEEDIWMVRYTEALAMEAAYQRRRASRAEARLADIERRLTILEGGEL
jgi:hypothetical protein